MYDHQAKKLNEQGTFKEIVVEISARQLSAKSETLRQMSMFLTQAVFMEVCVHPKPGLVTRHGSGAHTDMSILTFAAGSAVLAKAFSDLQILGMKHNGNYQELFGKVRRYGVSAEQELLRVTKGVNTQRGILFAGGLLAASCLEIYSDSVLFVVVAARRASSLISLTNSVCVFGCRRGCHE